MTQDRFKYRVWDLETKTMHEVFAIDWADGKPITCHTESKKLYQQFDYDTFVLIQSTGVPDTGGRLIYEGDVVEVELSEGRAFTNGKKDIFRLEIFWGSDASYHGRRIGTGDLYSVRFSGSAVVRREVIGNIYKNPDLIKDIK